MGMDQYIRRITLIPNLSKDDSLLLLSINGVRGENLCEFRKYYELNDILGPIIGSDHTILPTSDPNQPWDYNTKNKIENGRLYELKYEPLFNLWLSLPDSNPVKHCIYDFMMLVSENDEENTIICFAAEW